MKKTILIILFLSLFFVISSCDNQYNGATVYLTNITVEDDYKLKLDYSIDYNYLKRINDSTKASVGIIYKFYKTNEVQDLESKVIDNIDITNKSIYIILPDDLANLEIEFTLFVDEYENNMKTSTYQSSVYKKTLKDIALNSTSNASYDILHYGQVKIKNLSIYINLSKYETYCDNDNVFVSIVKPLDYVNINIKISPNEGFFFARNITILLNDIEVKHDKIKADGNSLTYSFADPNWSNVY